jgi:hypothetical protein
MPRVGSGAARGHARAGRHREGHAAAGRDLQARHGAEGRTTGAKVFIPEIGASLNRAGRLSVALNRGNEGNRQRLLDGDRWTQAQVDAIVRTLSPVELQFVNDVHEYIDSFWPEIQAQQLRVSSLSEEKVQASRWAATASDGSQVQMRGGYYLLGLVVGVRELSGLIGGYPYAGPPVDRIVTDVAKTVQQVKQGEVDEPAVAAVVRLLGDAFGIPATQAVRSYRGWVAWSEGNAPASAILMGPPPKD